MIALDLFAGTGWGVACRELGIEEYGVDNWKPVIETREANGMTTLFKDVWDGLDGTEEVPEFDLLIASPPCQTFSIAGTGAGRQALDTVLGLVESGRYKEPGVLRDFVKEHGGDDRTALVLTPLAYASRYRPAYVVLEQVPPVLPVWQACGAELEAMGYSVAVALMHAEQYGVPQTRRRAILIARRDGVEATIPPPTHSRYYSRTPGKLDEGVLPWISMAEALGWGMTQRPYLSVSSGTKSGGTDPAALGGSGARRTLHQERDEGRWKLLSQYSTGGDYQNRGERDPGEPGPTVTSHANRNKWIYERPSTTIVGTFRPDIVAAPGYRKAGDGPRQNAEGSINVTFQEAACLQSYPADFVWKGAKGQVFQQIGNAVPPKLAAAILQGLL